MISHEDRLKAGAERYGDTTKMGSRLFIFVDAKGNKDSVEACNEAAAWKMMGDKFAMSVQGMREIGLKLENAYGRKTIAGHPDGDQISFIHCQHCDESINESKIEEHLHAGHDVEVVMKPPKGDR